MSRNSGWVLSAVGTAAVAMAVPAVAHPGPHNTMSFSELAAHYASGWHLAMLLGAGVIATLIVFVAANRGRQARQTRAAHNRRGRS